MFFYLESAISRARRPYHTLPTVNSRPRVSGRMFFSAIMPCHWCREIVFDLYFIVIVFLIIIVENIFNWIYFQLNILQLKIMFLSKLTYKLDDVWLTRKILGNSYVILLNIVLVKRYLLHKHQIKIEIMI